MHAPFDMHTADDFKQLAKQTSNGQLRTRYPTALYHFKNGETRTQIATYLGVARGSVNTVSWRTLEGLQNLVRVDPVSSPSPSENRSHILSKKMRLKRRGGV